MKISTMLALSAVTLAASISATLAGPCTVEIDAMEARINAVLDARAAAGPGAQEQATVAGRHVQPTLHSVENVEAKIGDIAPETVELIRDGMARARAADVVGNDVACKEALAKVQGAIGP